MLTKTRIISATTAACLASTLIAPASHASPDESGAASTDASSISQEGVKNEGITQEIIDKYDPYVTTEDDQYVFSLPADMNTDSAEIEVVENSIDTANQTIEDDPSALASSNETFAGGNGFSSHW